MGEVIDLKRIVFYDDFGEMECLAGDTLPGFEVGVETDAGESLTGCSMQLILTEWSRKDKAVVCKSCAQLPDGSGFVGALTSEDTARLAGVFMMHFRLIDANGLSQRKLAGVLTVKPCAQGEGVTV